LAESKSEVTANEKAMLRNGKFETPMPVASAKAQKIIFNDSYF
jgi:hypothetical protein